MHVRGKLNFKHRNKMDLDQLASFPHLCERQLTMTSRICVYQSIKLRIRFQLSDVKMLSLRSVKEEPKRTIFLTQNV